MQRGRLEHGHSRGGIGSEEGTLNGWVNKPRIKTRRKSAKALLQPTRQPRKRTPQRRACKGQRKNLTGRSIVCVCPLCVLPTNTIAHVLLIPYHHPNRYSIFKNRAAAIPLNRVSCTVWRPYRTAMPESLAQELELQRERIQHHVGAKYNVRPCALCFFFLCRFSRQT